MRSPSTSSVRTASPCASPWGPYGIGVSRLVAVIAEQQHDELGLRWPASVAPFDVHVVIANKDAEARAGAEALAADLDRLGHEVLLLDDRTASPGVKFRTPNCSGCRGSWWSDAAGPTGPSNCATGSPVRSGRSPPRGRAGRRRRCGLTVTRCRLGTPR